MTSYYGNWVVVCPVGGHPGNYEYFGPFEGPDHCRLWLQSRHRDCSWGGGTRDFQQHNGHQFKRMENGKIEGSA